MDSHHNMFCTGMDILRLLKILDTVLERYGSRQWTLYNEKSNCKHQFSLSLNKYFSKKLVKVRLFVQHVSNVK